MTNDETKNLCLSVLHADDESEVIQILKKAYLWDASECWRLYGDRSGNWSTINNQQSRPEAALVEKIINSVDARLMNACLVEGIDPESNSAPGTIKDAVGQFFEGKQSGGGDLREWLTTQIKEEAKNITICATGPNKKPSLTIADKGEGQTPDDMPGTFLSIDRENKLRIPFVQGKFNMGGTGALKFCGNSSIQLIISRRNPAIVSNNGTVSSDDGCWGFTIVRRELPSEEAGAVRNSVLKYLAPVGAEDEHGKGEVLRFHSPSLKTMPLNNEAYTAEMEWGSVLKMYDYDMKGYASHILMKGGLLRRLEVLLPEIALPVSMHECRNFRGKAKGSFVTPMSGLVARLEEGKGENLEEGFPKGFTFSVGGETFVARVFAFKKDKASTYRTNEGVIFTINGQTHGYIPKSLFGRNRVKMGRLADSLLVTVDCSEISTRAREDLFLNSRDRLSNGQLRKEIERRIEQDISSNEDLRLLREQRREQEIADRLDDSKPLEDVLKSILKSSPSLAQLFGKGLRLHTPYKNKGGPGQDVGTEDGTNDFVGKRHPTFFRFSKKEYGFVMERNAELGRRCRLKFETDVADDYFDRVEDPGVYKVEISGVSDPDSISNSLTLHKGIGNWSIDISEDLEVGDQLTVRCRVYDEVNPEGFTNTTVINVVAMSNKEGSTNGERESRRESGGSNGQDQPAGIKMPDIVRVKEEDWQQHGFDKSTACEVIADVVTSDGKEETVYTFQINVDNIYLKTEMKPASVDASLVEAKFVYGNVLTGLALINDKTINNGNGSGSEDEESLSVEEFVGRTTKALGPFIVPMIDNLGALTGADVTSLGMIGDDE